MANDFSELAEDIEAAADQLPDDVEAGLRTSLTEIRNAAQRNINDATGALANSGEVTVTSTRHTVRGGVQFGEVGDDTVAPAAAVEYGTGLRGDTAAFASKIDSPDGVGRQFLRRIQEWIDNAGVVGALYSGDPADGGGEISPLAHAIAWSIVEYGTNPSPYLRPAWLRRKHRPKQEITNKIDDTLSRIERRHR